jgi:hypothetical protein
MNQRPEAHDLRETRLFQERGIQAANSLWRLHYHGYADGRGKWIIEPTPDESNSVDAEREGVGASSIWTDLARLLDL